MEFEWDPQKVAENLIKRGVSFEEAEQAFDDENAVELFDDLHSSSEIRFQLIAASPLRLLCVAFTERLGRTRIISARNAERKERQIYHEYNG